VVYNGGEMLPPYASWPEVANKKRTLVISPDISSYSNVVASRRMKTKSVFVALLLWGVAAAQQPTPKRMIYGIVIGQDGEPAKEIYLAAEPLGGSVRSSLPHTKTNDAGEYLFKNLYQWGKYAIYADDQNAGYSLISTGPASINLSA